jgi:hypothetical protein
MRERMGGGSVKDLSSLSDIQVLARSKLGPLPSSLSRV